MSHAPILIEGCVDSVPSAMAAAAGGADRVELCDNPPRHRRRPRRRGGARRAHRDGHRSRAHLSLFRRFPIRERLNLEARIEPFNVTNTPKFQNPDGNPASAGFMTVAATDPNRPERQVRVALRLVF